MHVRCAGCRPLLFAFGNERDGISDALRRAAHARYAR
jgi:hypothetical protein